MYRADRLLKLMVVTPLEPPLPVAAVVKLVPSVEVARVKTRGESSGLCELSSLTEPTVWALPRSS